MINGIGAEFLRHINSRKTHGELTTCTPYPASWSETNKKVICRPSVVTSKRTRFLIGRVKKRSLCKAIQIFLYSELISYWDLMAPVEWLQVSKYSKLTPMLHF
jgi:hypothetical protein